MTIIEVRPHEGGEEAYRFAGELIEATASYLARQGSSAVTGSDGQRVLTLETDASPGEVQWLSGVHKVQRASKGARHTSAASLAVLNSSKSAAQPT